MRHMNELEPKNTLLYHAAKAKLLVCHQVTSHYQYQNHIVKTNILIILNHEIIAGASFAAGYVEKAPK